MTMEEEIHTFISASNSDQCADGFGLDDNLIDTGILDSMAIMQLIAYLEGEYGILVEACEVTEDHFGSVRSVAEYVRCKRAPGKSVRESCLQPE